MTGGRVHRPAVLGISRVVQFRLRTVRRHGRHGVTAQLNGNAERLAGRGLTLNDPGQRCGSIRELLERAEVRNEIEVIGNARHPNRVVAAVVIKLIPFRLGDTEDVGVEADEPRVDGVVGLARHESAAVRNAGGIDVAVQSVQDSERFGKCEAAWQGENDLVVARSQVGEAVKAVHVSDGGADRIAVEVIDRDIGAIGEVDDDTFVSRFTGLIAVAVGVFKDEVANGSGFEDAGIEGQICVSGSEHHE